MLRGKWEVIFGDEFEVWYEKQEKGLKEEITAIAILLAREGPTLPRPYSDTLEHSNLAILKELRIKYKNQPWRVLYAFDPIRRAIILLGGNKAGIKNWYEKNIPIAEERFVSHLKKMEKEHGNKT